MRDRLITAGIVPTASTPEQFDEIVRDDIETMTQLVRETGLRKP